MRFYISYLGILSLVVLGRPGLAQVTSDGTHSTTVTTSDDRHFTIDNGDRVGNNLFHSFREFSVPTGGSAFFNNAVDVQNIFSRVTGSTISNIDGLLRTNGTANLFLLNPNGIIFGANAQLNIGGSFVGSTASSIRFADGAEFSALKSNPSLLTVSTPIGLQFGQTSGNIQVNGLGNQEPVPTTNFGLAIAPGRTLAFVGGDVTFNSGIATAAAGRLEVGSVRTGTVALTPTTTGWRLGYDSAQTFGTIQLLNRSSLWNPYPVSNPEGGIQVWGDRIVLNNSQIAAAGLGNQSSSDINIQATGGLELSGNGTGYPFSSWIVNQVTPGASGNGGQIQVTTPNLSIRDGARIQTLSLGSGIAGEIRVNADNLLINGYSPANSDRTQTELFTSQISSASLATGNGGNIRINAQRIRLQDGGQIGTFTGGQSTGNGGDITVNASRAIRMTGFNPTTPLPTGILTLTSGSGNGGDIDVSTPNLRLQDGSAVNSISRSRGQGGDITVRATNSIVADRVSPAFGFLTSTIQALSYDSGRGGDVQVNTGRLRLLNGASLGTFTLFPTDGSPITATSGTGNAGNVRVNARDSIEVDGDDLKRGGNVSVLSSLAFAIGDAGNVTVSTRRLFAGGGGSVSSGVVPGASISGAVVPGTGSGNGGNLTVNASQSIEVRGRAAAISDNSDVGIFSLGSGSAGRAVINTPRLSIFEGADVAASTIASGNAGQLTINASNILVNGSQIDSSAVSADEVFRRTYSLPLVPTGDTGNVTINADRLTVENGGRVGVQHEGTGNAGQLSINANEIVVRDRGRITASTAFGGGGEVSLNVQRFLRLQNAGQVSAEAGGRGNGGNIQIDSPFIFAFNNSDIIANADRGNGGRIDITTNGIFGAAFRQNLTPASDITASSDFGLSGTVSIETPNVTPGQDLAKLPTEVMDSSQQLANQCNANSNSQFIITGQGGLPLNPTSAIAASNPWTDLRDPLALQVTESQAVAPTLPLAEATTWQIDDQGNVYLVAIAPASATVHPATCGH
jgi:filamentous hemagglutinin family protein